jgi:CheY-like chemotaxis protein
MVEELIMSGAFILILVIVCVISNYYSRKEEKMKEERKKQQYEQFHTLSGRINFHRERELGSYKLDEYKIGDWEKEVRKNMKSIVKINQKYKPNKEIKVLIGDYDKMSVSNSVSVLESMGLNVTIAKSAIEIMERLNNGGTYDLIITNNIYDRGNCDGPQLLYELRNCNIKIPIVVLTVSHNQRAEFLSEGFNEYMTKLLDQEKVKDALPRVIEDLKFIKQRS